jgi:ABC-2 type transport system ATP-binding protein/lipopolysaccharide transport system ATP-binding protein
VRDGVKELAIEFRDVSHHFRVFTEGRMASLKEWLIRRVKRRKVELQRVVALDNVSFEVGQGQALGLIGHNGAGKSSLLRIAAGILQPRAGTAIVRGLVAPILELGFGFEQELTGRENIVFNGAILGRSRQEMNERMEEIVSFAELSNFIDQPIRTYSTGMVARLAFSIATAVDAQILLLDEVLSVGDERFQRKCAERIDRFRNNGVTILFVSHALPSVEMLCDKVIWLQNGRIQCEGETKHVIDEYRRWMNAG